MKKTYTLIKILIATIVLISLSNYNTFANDWIYLDPNTPNSDDTQTIWGKNNTSRVTFPSYLNSEAKEIGIYYNFENVNRTEDVFFNGSIIPANSSWSGSTSYTKVFLRKSMNVGDKKGVHVIGNDIPSTDIIQSVTSSPSTSGSFTLQGLEFGICYKTDYELVSFGTIGSGNVPQNRTLNIPVSEIDLNKYEYFISYELYWYGNSNISIPVENEIKVTQNNVIKHSNSFLNRNDYSVKPLINFEPLDITSTGDIKVEMTFRDPGQEVFGDQKSMHVRIVKKEKPKAKIDSVKLETSNRIGDNTHLTYKVKVTHESNIRTEVIGNIRGVESKMSLQNGNGEVFITFNSKDIGEVNISTVKFDAVDAYGRVDSVEWNGEVDIKFLLSSTWDKVNSNNGLANILIINDSDRHYDNNIANQNLVQQIKSKADGIYLINNDVSPVLQPLLGY